MKFLNDIEALQVTEDLTTEMALMLVNNVVKKRNLGDTYLKSVTLNLPNIFNPVTGQASPAANTLTYSLLNQTAKTFFAAPILSNGTPSFRPLTFADISDFYTAVDKAQLNYWTLSGANVYRNTGKVFINSASDLGAYNLQVTGDSYFSGNIFLPTTAAAHIYKQADVVSTLIRATRSDTSQQGLFRSNGWGDFTFSNSVGIGYDLAGASQGTGRLSISNSMGIGDLALSDISLRISRSITGGTTSYGVYQNGTVQSGVTAAAFGFRNTVNTVAATFTIPIYVGYQADANALGAGSVITTIHGFRAVASLGTAGGTANAFAGEIAAGTNKWNIYMSGTASNFMQGSLGIGTTGLAAYSLRVSRFLTGNTSAFGIEQAGQVQSDVTGAAYGFRNVVTTSAATFTLSNYHNFIAESGTIGAGSVITTLNGFYAFSNLGTAASTVFGFRGGIAANTNKWNLFMDGTANNYLAGSLGIGSTNLTDINLRVSKNISGATTAYGLVIDGVIQSGVTTRAVYFQSSISTAPAAFTVTELIHFFASQTSVGAGSSIGNQYGFVVSSGLTGGGSNFAYTGNIAANSNNWNLYMGGTAKNYLRGKLIVGTVNTEQSYQVYVETGADSNDAGYFRGKLGQAFVKSQVLYADANGVLTAATGANIATLLGSSASAAYILNQNASAQTANLWITGSARIDSNIGIGTAVSATSEIRMEVPENNYAIEFIKSAATLGGLHFNSNIFNIGLLGAATQMDINVSGGSRLRIDASGNIGIGGITTPSYRLHVSGVGLFTTELFGSPATEDGYRIKLRDYGGINNDAGIGIHAASGAVWFNNVVGGGYYWNNGTGGEVVRIDGSGNLGVGISVPLHRQHNNISLGGVGVGLMLTNDATNATIGRGVGILFGGSSNANLAQIEAQTLTATNNTGGLIFKTANAGTLTERVRIDQNGNVAIGTQSINSRLNVRDAVNARIWLDNSAANTPYAYFEVNTTATPYLAIQAGDTLNYRNIHLNGLGGNVVVGSNGAYNASKFQVNGEIWGNSSLILQNTAPTMFFRDTDNRGAAIRTNSNDFYILRLNDTQDSWAPATSPAYAAGLWPLIINLETNAAAFGGSLSQAYAKNTIVYAEANGTLVYATAQNVTDLLGDGAYIKNQIAAAQSANYWINGNVIVGPVGQTARFTISGTHANATFMLFSQGNNTATTTSSLSMWASEPTLTYDGCGIGANINQSPAYGRRETAQAQSYIRFQGGKIFFAASTTETLDPVNNSKMILSSDGKVGIGTVNPQQIIHALGNIRLSSTSAIRLEFDKSGSYFNWIEADGNSTTNFVRIAAGNAESIRFLNNGKVLIGTTSENTYKVRIDAGSAANNGLHINGNLNVTGNAIIEGFFQGTSSDRNLKSDFKTISVIDKIDQIGVYSYRHKNYTDGRLIGSVAQELQKFFPELITTDSKGFLRVNEYGYAALSFQLCKEIVAEMRERDLAIWQQTDKHTEEIAKLKIEVRKLKTKVRQLTKHKR